jgi:multisubunit Na+/H+ antiporter MnhB subunit
MPAPSMETLDEIGPIGFAGAIDEQHLHEFLSMEGHVGCAPMLMGSIGIGLILLVLSLMGGGFTAIAIGVMGFVLVVMTVSTIRYRRLVFQNLNPHWNRPVRGELRTAGVQLERGQTSAFFRWDWYVGAVISDQLVAFLPATQMAQPLMVSKPMLVNLDDWNRVRQVAAAIGIVSDADSVEDRRRHQNLQILRDPNRERRIKVPSDAIPFEGVLTASDFSQIPRRYHRRQRPVRTQIVNAILYTLAGLVVVGISLVVFQQVAMLPIIVVVYIIAAIAFGKMRHSKNSSGAVYYLKAFATESSIVTDFAVTTTEVSWSALQPVLRTDNVVSLRRREWIQFIVARRNMFASDEAWDRFNQLVDDAERKSQSM